MSFNVVGIGEVLWDLLPDGPQLGGAPTNFAYHARALGANAEIITRVGNDAQGREIIQRIERMGLAVTSIQVDGSTPTGTVSVSLSDTGIPEYTIQENVAWDHIAVSRDSLARLRAARAVCFGTLAQRSPESRQSIQRLLSSAQAGTWLVLDANLRQSFYNREIIAQSLRLANVLKLNDDELPVLAEMFCRPGDARGHIEALAARFSLRVVALTCGGKGSLLYRDGQWSECAAPRVEVKDTIGAGDAFTAALCLGLLRGLELHEISAAANRLAAFVCSCAGATPELPEEFRQLFRANSEIQTGA